MSKWGNKLAAALARADSATGQASASFTVLGVAASKAAERAASMGEAARTAAKLDKADKERGHVYESKLKRG